MPSQETKSNAAPWIDWARKLQAIAQNGLNYARDPYDIERYTALREIVAEMLVTGSGAELSVVRHVISADMGHSTPKVDVRGVVFRDNKILLVRERAEGLWSLPGGWADPGESAAESVVREVFEESGFQTESRKLLAVFDRAKHDHQPPFLFHVYKIFILCALTGGAAAVSSETDEVGFFGETELPPLSITRITPWQLQRMFEHHRNPGLPADYD